METELDQLQEKEQYDVKYIAELQEYWNTYMYALINEIYVGIGINLGLPEKTAYKIAKTNPKILQKAGFFKSIFDKFKGIFTYKVPKFRYQDPLYNDGDPMTDNQWKIFDKYIDNFFQNHAKKVAEDIGIKSYMLGSETSNFREKKKSYKNKSLYQVDFDQYDGNMPKTLVDAYHNYDFSHAEKDTLNQSLSKISMYVNETNNSIKEAIRHQIQNGLENNKSNIEIASDLYWNVEER